MSNARQRTWSARRWAKWRERKKKRKKNIFNPPSASEQSHAVIFNFSKLAGQKKNLISASVVLKHKSCVEWKFPSRGKLKFVQRDRKCDHHTNFFPTSFAIVHNDFPLYKSWSFKPWYFPIHSVRTLLRAYIVKMAFGLMERARKHYRAENPNGPFSDWTLLVCPCRRCVMHVSERF